MDVSQYNTRVLKEPRGMIRAIQLVFAILAFATTSGFDTNTSFTASCPPSNVTKVSFPVEYPFKFESQKIRIRESCAKEEMTDKNYPMDFSSSAQFYVATGVLSFIYTIGCLVLYIFGTRHYETNPLVPVIDLVTTAILTIFWLAGTCAWTAGVSDVKTYTKPEYLMSLLDFCNIAKNPNGTCLTDFPGKFASLNISLIFGFANIFLWGASMWFVFKETSLHRKPTPDQMTTPGSQPTAGFGAYGDQNVSQPQMPSQTHFPQQKQFADGY